MTVSYAECEAGWEVVTPDLRLAFVRLVDRWTHRIDLGPGPWQAAAEAVEWTTAADDPLRVVSPVYQEVQVSQDGAAVVVLAVGQAGPHHFSAAVRVSYGVFEAKNRAGQLNAYPKSLVVFDVADRCRAETLAFDCRYRVHKPPAVCHLGDSGDSAAGGISPRPRPFVMWEADTPRNYEVLFNAKMADGPPCSVAVTAADPDGWDVRASPDALVRGGTNRVRYAWSQTRVILPDEPRPPGPIVPRSLMNP